VQQEDVVARGCERRFALLARGEGEGLDRLDPEGLDDRAEIHVRCGR